ncbi:MAG: hypothetical protein M1814_006781 [Vezdaea aestivalis]|nr:MAG: hypothetical protein M1814_006781 [Vezdaea aestivalis]
MPPSTRTSPRKVPPSPSNLALTKPAPSPKQHHLILPKGLSPQAKILSLPHPQTSEPSRFIFDPSPNPPRLYQLTSMTQPRRLQRSILISPDPSQPPSPWKGTMTSNANLTIATPLDPLFLLLPFFALQVSLENDNPYRSLDDILSSPAPTAIQSYIFSHPAFESVLLSRAAAISDTLCVCDTTMFRLNLEKLHAELLSKARSTLSADPEPTLPPSLERHFTTPILEEPFRLPPPEVETETLSQQETGLPTPPESQTSLSSTLQPNSTPSIPSLQRLALALSLLAPLLPSALSPLNPDSPLAKLPEHKGLFEPLSAHLSALSTRRVEAITVQTAARRGLGSLENDFEAEADRMEKKRKRDEADEAERKRKKGASRGVKQLAKVDTTGMRSMTSFFTKKPAIGKS